MGTDLQPVDYRRALEALRSGVPNRDAVSALGSNQRKAESKFVERLSSVATSAKQGKQVHGLLLAGGFGTGKSHLLDFLEHLAVEKNFVCSRVVISKETPLHDAVKMYLAAIDRALVPSLSGEAVRELALRVQPNSRNYAEFLAWANSPASGLSDLFRATILLHYRLSNDPELVDQITNFWSGEPLAISRIRQGLKQIGFTGTYSLKPVKAKDLALQRFLFASRLILAAGYSGWVLLIDEVELVGRYSLLQRGRSYAELARWMGRVEGEACPGLTVVAAITDDFGLAMLQEKNDRDVVGARFRAKGTDEFITLAGRAETGMRLIEREALTLEPPDESTLLHTYRRLKEIHAKAYNWDPPEIPAGVTLMTRRMRSYVRRWVNEWDLKRIYPGAVLSVEDEQEMRPTYEQDDALEQLSELPQLE
ncbi:MAG: BREX system ATP-binding domain-containing protein [Bryobacteraceae bacterium]